MKYSIQFVKYTTISLEADNEEQAWNKAQEWYMTNVDPDGPDEGDILPESHWPSNQFEI